VIRQHQRYLAFLYALADAAAVEAAFLAAWWVKFRSGWLGYGTPLPFSTYFLWSTVYAALVVAVGYFGRFYVPKRRKRFAYELYKALQTHAVAMLLLLGLLFAVKEVHVSRAFLAMFYAAGVGFVGAYRFAVKTALKTIRKKGYNKQFVLIVGAGSVGRRFYKNLQQFPELGYEVIGFLDDFLDRHEPAHEPLPPILGPVDRLEDVLKTVLVDEVIVALPLDVHRKIGRIVEVCEKAGVKVHIIPDFFDYLPARPSFENFAGIPIINVRNIPLDDFRNRLLKRAFDIVFSLAVIVLTAPLMLLIAIGIKLTSPGPVLFRQERVGLNRRRFVMYKFRTMHVMPREQSDTTWTVENDPRRTRFGAFLRRTSLDELPQFFNVLMGHMSVVGPRPERPYFVEQFKEEIPNYMLKHYIRPGITGWAQTNGLRGDTSIEERIRHDLFYIENWTFLFDLKIILLTIVRGFRDRNAY